MANEIYKLGKCSVVITLEASGTSATTTAFDAAYDLKCTSASFELAVEEGEVSYFGTSGTVTEKYAKKYSSSGKAEALLIATTGCDIGSFKDRKASIVVSTAETTGKKWTFASCLVTPSANIPADDNATMTISWSSGDWPTEATL